VVLSEPFEVGGVLRAACSFRFDEIAEAQIRYADAGNPSNDAARVRLLEGHAPRDGQDVDTRIVTDVPVEQPAHAQDAVIGTTDSFGHASSARRPRRNRTTWRTGGMHTG